MIQKKAFFASPFISVFVVASATIASSAIAQTTPSTTTPPVVTTTTNNGTSTSTPPAAYYTSFDCNQQRSQWLSQQSKAHKICDQMLDDSGKPPASLKDCLNTFNCHKAPQDESDLDGVNDSCKQQLANNLNGAEKKDLDELKTATENEQKAEKEMIDGSKAEAKLEADLKDQITHLQEDLATFIETNKTALEDFLNASKDQISSLETDIQNARADEQQIGKDRVALIESTKTKLEMEKNACVDAVAQQVSCVSSLAQCKQQNDPYAMSVSNPFGGFNLSTSTALGCVSAGGLGNCVCQKNRHAVAERMQTLRDMNSQLDKLNTAMSKEANDIANISRKIQATQEKLLTKQQQVQRQIAIKVQTTQQKIQSLYMQLQQAQQNYQREQQQQQAAIQTAQAIQAKASADYNSTLKSYNLVKDYYTGSGKTDDATTDRQTIIDGAGAEDDLTGPVCNSATAPQTPPAAPAPAAKSAVK